MVTSRHFFEYTPGQFHTVAHSRLSNQRRSGIIWLPGGGGTDIEFVTPDADPLAVGARDLIAYVSDVTGKPIVALDTQFTWGNSTGQGRLDALYDYLIGSLGWDSDLIFMGGSMGLQTVTVWAAANAAKIRAIAMLVPGVDIDAIHDANREGLAASINTAWGGAAAWEAAVPTVNPMNAFANLEGIPTHLWYSTDDPVVLPAEVTAFATLLGCGITSMGAAGGHSIDTLDMDQVLAFMEPYL